MSLERRGFLASMGALAGFAALKPERAFAAQAAQGWLLAGDGARADDVLTAAIKSARSNRGEPSW